MRVFDHPVFRLPLLFLLWFTIWSVQFSRPQNSCVPSLTCWYGIVPGTLSLNDAVYLLRYRDHINNLDIDEYSIYWRADIEGKQTGFSLYRYGNGMINQIDVRISQNQLTVADVIRQLGDPSEVGMSIWSTEPCEHGLIVYPEYGLIAYLYSEGDSVGVQPSQSIQALTLYTPEALQSPIDTIMTDVATYPWQGFMDYCDLLKKSLKDLYARSSAAPEYTPDQQDKSGSGQYA